jgi:hypothetical protein
LFQQLNSELICTITSILLRVEPVRNAVSVRRVALERARALDANHATRVRLIGFKSASDVSFVCSKLTRRSAGRCAECIFIVGVGRGPKPKPKPQIPSNSVSSLFSIHGATIPEVAPVGPSSFL